MDAIALSLKMKRLSMWVDGQCQPIGLVQRQFDAPPFGNCYVTIDPERQGPYASSNYNRVHICGTETGMEANGLDRLIELFKTKGVKRFFVWLSPGPNMDLVRHWLEERGLSRNRRNGYPTLSRESRTPIHFRTDLAVREVGTDDVVRAHTQLGDTMWPEYTRSAGKKNFFHYMAFDANRAVAIATLCVFEDLGYLMAAATAESHRQRGAQQALIASRVERGEQIGCTTLVSETLYVLQHSHRNLQRAGFQEVYEKEVFEWNA